MVITKDNLDEAKKELHRLRMEITFEGLLTSRQVEGTFQSKRGPEWLCASVWLRGASQKILDSLEVRIRNLELDIERYKIACRNESKRIITRPTSVLVWQGSK